MGMNQSKSVFSSNIYKAGASAAALSIIIYIFFGPNRFKPPSFSGGNKFKILGLHNFGQTCYLNAVLQAIAACNYTLTWLEQRNQLNNLTSPTDISRNGTFHTHTGEASTPYVVYSKAVYPIVAVLHKAMQVINRDVQADDDLMSRVVPGEVFEAFNSGSVPMLSRHEEQDAHEIFNIITGSLCDSLESREGHQYLNSVQNQLKQETRDLESAESEHDLKTGAIGMGGDSEVVLNPEALLHKYINGKVLGSGGDGDGHAQVKGKSRVNTRIGSTTDNLVIKEIWTDNLTPFTGLFASQLQCIYCFHKTSINCEVFTNITLSLPAPTYTYTQSLSVKDLLSSYLKSTLVHQVDCGECSKNRGIPMKTTFYKRNCLVRLPKTLVLHIHRTEWGPHGLSNKRLDFVRFETQMDLSQIDGIVDLISAANNNAGSGLLVDDLNYVEHQNADPRRKGFSGGKTRYHNSQYQLRAVICHRGDAESGHFITYRRASKNDHMGGWFMVSDTMVCPVTIETVLQSNAYMIFYEKIDCGAGILHFS